MILAHAQVPYLAGGFIGVDVFFVLSGFLITGLLLRRYSEGQLNLLAFYLARIKRLAPALIVMVIGSVLAAHFLLLPWMAEERLHSTPYALLWISNIFFHFRGVNYFAEGEDQDLFLHTWSLGVEEQFYLIWPLLMLMVLMISLKAPPAQRLWWIFTGYGVIFTASLVLCLEWTAHGGSDAFYLMPTRIWQFALGGMVATAISWSSTAKSSGEKPRSLLKGWPQMATCLGIVLILGSALLIHPEHPYPGWRAIFPSIATVLIIGGGASVSQRSGYLSHPILTWIGDRSYSLYLWHWPVLMIAAAKGMLFELPQLIVLLAIVVILAMASYKWIELPFWKGKWSSVTAPKHLFSATISITLALFIWHALASSDDSRDLLQAEILSARTDLPALYADGCDDFNRSDEVRPCSLGGEPHQLTAILVGDSIGVQWASAFQDILVAHGWQFIVLTKSSCPIIDRPAFSERLGGQYLNCESWREKVREYLHQRQPDLLLVGSSSDYDYSVDDWADGTRSFLDPFLDSRPEILLIAPTPKLEFDGPSCVYDAQRTAPDRVESACVSVAQPETPAHAGLRRIATHQDGVQLLDLGHLACPDGKCHAWRAGDYIFRDASHLSDTFVRSISQQVREELNALDEQFRAWFDEQSKTNEQDLKPGVAFE